MKSKDVAAILEQKGIAVKTQKPLEPSEFDLLFETLTKENQITNIEDYLDGITYIPSKKKAVAVAKEEPSLAATEAPAVQGEKKGEEPKAEVEKKETKEVPAKPQEAKKPVTTEKVEKAEKTEKVEKKPAPAATTPVRPQNTQ